MYIQVSKYRMEYEVPSKTGDVSYVAVCMYTMHAYTCTYVCTYTHAYGYIACT